jgi:alkanesulfonate monooxygenase SsuD/methylene tetrahydromethanopterin reductase-like flavin-dependent oxidoreductase (luciferase family)
MSKLNKGSDKRVPRWDEEPEIVKFIRCDAVQYEGDWDPAAYDPESARATFESTIADAVEAERLGFDGIVTTEHHFDAWTLVPSPNVYLAAVARETSKIRLGHSVQVLSVHNPWRLAEEAGMLDMLSNGRAEIGVGKGNFSIERARYTPPESELDSRYDEGLELLQKALREHSVTFDGRYTRIKEPSTVYPRPFNPMMRLWLPATRLESATRVGEMGQNLFGFLSPFAGEIFAGYIEAGRNAGHDFSGANYMVITSIIVAPTEAEAIQAKAHATTIATEALARRGLPEEETRMLLPVFSGAIIGTPETVYEQLRTGLIASGARRLNLVFRLRGIPEDVARQTQQLFAAEIMPHLRNLPTPADEGTVDQARRD